MKPQAHFHEILFFTGAGFNNRPLSIKDDNNDKNNSSRTEGLERACWDGLLHEMFPEILGSFKKKCESFIWHIMSGKNFLSVNIGPIPPVVENETTIDPYFFLTDVREN
jgi:hypothetical protein